MKRSFLILVGVLTLAAPPSKAEDAIDQGLWWLYHAQYDKARDSFDAYIREHPDDPAGYFYLTATDWWHLAQDIEYDLPDAKSRLETNSHRTIEVAKKLYESAKDDKTKARASFYWGGAEGLWGRWLVMQREWVDAYFAGKRGYKMLKRSLALDPKLYDAYLGLGIYDYYTDTLSGVQAVLASLLIHGNKERGIKELETAIEKGERGRVEAMCFLVEIYTSEEKQPEKALPLAEELHKKYPQSPAMHLIKVSSLYSANAWHDVLPEAEDFLKKTETEIPWYTHHYIPAARYCLGVAKLFGKHDLEGAEAEFRKIMAEANPKSRWINFSKLRMGQIYDLRGEREKALVEYRGAMKGPEFWDLQKEASMYMKKPFKF